MYVVLSFDVEDIYFPPKYHLDDIPGWIAEIMSECGIHGTFNVMGEKARSLKKRGRIDVIKKMALHDIASHTQGNHHPLIPEILQDKGWKDGVQAMREYEDKVKEDLCDVFGCKPAALSRHNVMSGPQHIAVAGERKIPYMYAIPQIKGYDQPIWYAGTLTFPTSNASYSNSELRDITYSCDDLFEKHLKELKNFLRDRIERGFEYVNVFGGHPVRVMSRGWQEHYCLANGMMRQPRELGWLYGVKSPEEEKRARTNFRRLVMFLRDYPDVEVVGIKQAAGLFSIQLPYICRDVLTFYAQDVEQAGKPVFHSTFSPAELVYGFIESLIYAEKHSDLPAKVTRLDVLGPKSLPVIGIEKDIITHTELISLCQQIGKLVLSEKYLPANIQVSNRRIGLGQFALLVARSYLAQAHYEKYEKLCVREVQRYPDAAFEVDNWLRRGVGEHWGFPPDFTCDKIVEQARLQTWTMKPAWLSPPQGSVSEGERILL